MKIVTALFSTLASLASATALALVNPIATNLLSEDWMAEIYVVGDSESDVHFFCKGALIASQWVLTSGYCITDPFKAYDAAMLSDFPEYRVKLGKSGELIAVTGFEYSDDYSVGLMRLAGPTDKIPAKLSTSSAASLLNKEVHILSTESSPAINHSFYNPGNGARMECNVDGLVFSTNPAAPYSAMCYILAKTTVGTRLYRTNSKVIDPEAAGSPNSTLDKIGGFDKTGARLYLDFRASTSYPCHEDIGSPILATREDGTVEIVGIVSAVGEARGMPMCNQVLYNKFSAVTHYRTFIDTTMAELEFAALCPAAPVIQVEYLNDTKIRIYWKAVTGATGYKIHFSTDVGYEKIITMDVGARQEVTTPLASNIDYTLALTSYNALCSSEVSKQRTVGF